MSGIEAAATVPTQCGPWWVSAILVPIAVAMIGVIGTLFALSQTEWYRRLSRWEPYSQLLWAEQRNLYWEVCHAADEALRAASRCRLATRNAGQQEWKVEEDFHEKQRLLQVAGLHAWILLSDEFNAAATQFFRELCWFNDSTDPQRSLGARNEIRKLYEKLFDSARRSLGVRELDTATRDLMRAATQELKNAEVPSSHPSQ